MPRRYKVVLTDSAVRDWQELHEYIAAHDSEDKAAYVSDRIEATLAALQTFPERGACTKELQALGIRRYRETYFKPYRVIYSVDADRVLVHLIVDGRRDMQTLLQKRLLRP